MKKEYELTFWGAGTVTYIPRYRKMHASVADATLEAKKVLAGLERRGYSDAAAAHPPIVYGPGCADGTRVLPR